MNKNILEILFICSLITIFLLLTADLFGNEACYNYYNVPSEHKSSHKGFSEQLEYILKINPKTSIDDILEITEAIDASHIRTGLTKIVFLSICAWESKLKKNAIGKIDKNDKGICQVNKYTYNWFKKKNYINGEWSMIFDIKYNIHVASVILMNHRKRLLKIFPFKTSKEINKILIESYNKGINGVLKLVRNEERFDYYNKVIKIRGI